MIKLYEFGMSTTADYLMHSIFKSHENGSTMIAANPRNISYLEDNESWALSGKQETNKMFGKFYVVIYDASTSEFYVKFFNDEMMASKRLSGLEVLIKEFDKNGKLTVELKMSKDFLVWKFSK